MTPEEKVSNEIWWVLKKIRTEELRQQAGKPIEWVMQARPIPTIPPIGVRQAGLLKVEELGGIKVISQEVEDDTYGKDFIYTFEIIRPKFDELYTEYEEKQYKRFNTNLQALKLYDDLTTPPELRQAEQTRLLKEQNILLKELSDKVPSINSDWFAVMEANKKFAKEFIKKGEEREALKSAIIEELKLGGVDAQKQSKRPYCVIEGRWGFLKFGKQGQKIQIGKANSQPFKLLRCLTELFGTAKSVDVVFEAIREGVKYKSKSGVYTSGIDKAKKIQLIGYVIKELQKGDKLQGKLAFKWDDLKIKIWLEYLG